MNNFQAHPKCEINLAGAARAWRLEVSENGGRPVPYVYTYPPDALSDALLLIHRYERAGYIVHQNVFEVITGVGGEQC